MPPKSQLPKEVEKTYRLISIEEVKQREQKYNNRLSDLRVCLRFVDEALEQVAEINEELLLSDKWHDYVTCNPLPKPYIPPDIRLLFEKLKTVQQASIDSNIDWILAIKERSILNQNIFRKDKTRLFLENKIKPNFGYEYNEYINMSLNVIKRIEYFLANNVELAKCPSSIVEDIKQLKLATQEHILDFCDRFTYRILCSEVAYMQCVCPISTEYYFSADNFQIHIWALRNVPIRFSHLEEPRLIANFHSINLRMHIPSTMLRLNLTIRAVLMNFDHISEKAKSYYQDLTGQVGNSNAGVEDLHKCLINEWLMQLNMQKQLRQEMVERRLDYEEKLRLYLEEVEKKKSKAKAKDDDDDTKNKAKPKVLKPPREVPLIGPDVYPDIYEDFLKQEKTDYEEFLSAYDPELMELDTDEINLKCHTILGGIYQLQYVEKPAHTDFNADGFNMTWHEHNGKLIKHDDIFIPSIPSFLSKRSTRLMSQMNIRRMSAMNLAEAQLQSKNDDSECPWFALTFILPEYLCLWGEPIACHYESITKFIENQDESTQKTPSVDGRRKGRKLIVEAAQSAAQAELEELEEQKRILEYFPFLVAFPDDLRPSVLKLVCSIPKDNFFRDSPSLQVGLGRIDRKARDADGTYNIHDFLLTMLLKKAEIRHLERHCLPRIISSFKFPKDIHDEELEASRYKSKGKGGILLRKASPGDKTVAEVSTRAFAFNDQQTNPERLFAIYKKPENIRIIRRLMDDNTKAIPMEPETFLDLMRIINYIKEQYLKRVRGILELKPFKPKVKLVNKRLKQRAKKKEPESATDKGSDKRSTFHPSAQQSVVGRPSDQLSVAASEMDEDINITSMKPQTETVPLKLSVYSADIKEPPTVTYNHWTTKHILHTKFTRKDRTLVIHTDRLGLIGFAFKRYEHFPFKYWRMEPSEEDPENEVIFTLETQCVRCVLVCTPMGIKGYVSEATKKLVSRPKMYLVIKEPVRDFMELRKMFKDRYLNIFPEDDAPFYIENGYFSPKHLATEMHTYSCMAIHSTQMKYNYSQWNRLATRRDIVLKFVQHKDIPENIVEIRITPDEAFFVEITELCSDDLESVVLKYTTTWRNITSFADLHHVIHSMYPSATESRCKNPKLISCIRDLLREVRPLSYS